MLPLALLLALATRASGVGVVPASSGQTRASGDDIRVLTQQIEQAVQSGDPERYLALVGATADRGRARDFATGELQAGVTRVVVQERDRLPLAGSLPGNGYQLLVDT